MSITVRLHHLTRYAYDRLVRLGPQVVRLRPTPHCRTPIAAYSLAVTPAQHVLKWQHDHYGNWLARVAFAEKTRELSVAVDLIAEIHSINPFDFFVEPYAESWPFQLPEELREDLAGFLAPEPAGARLREFVGSLSGAQHTTVALLVDINQRLHGMIRYLVRDEPGVQDPEATLAAAAGSCRDTAWLMVQVLRHLGLPARFVSGYLIQLKPETPPLDGGSGPDRDRADLHAWAEVYLPGAGWIGLDATSGLFCGEGHLPLAATPHFRWAAPITGTVEPSKVDFSTQMSIARSAEKMPAAAGDQQ